MDDCLSNVWYKWLLMYIFTWSGVNAFLKFSVVFEINRSKNSSDNTVSWWHLDDILLAVGNVDGFWRTLCLKTGHKC